MTGNLPSPSRVGLGVLRLTQREDLRLEDLAIAISGDPALTGRLLKLANSHHVDGGSTVTNVFDAAERLGIRSVRSVALGFCLVSEHRSGACEDFDYERYWSLSLASAFLAKNLANILRHEAPNDAFACSLLARVGMLALASVHPGRYAKTLRCTRGSSLTALLEAETSSFEITHSEVTAALLRDWRLPEAFCEVAMRLGQSGRVIDSLPPQTLRLMSIVNCAWMLGPELVTCANSTQASPTQNNTLQAVADANNIDLGYLSVAFQEALREWKEREELLTLFDQPDEEDTLIASQSSCEKPDVSGVLFDEEPQVVVDPLVMVVDDDERILRLLQHVLEKDGFRLVVARNGREALQLAAENEPQIIITDWRMPEMSGLDLCRRLKDSESLRNSYVIMLSAQEKVEDIEEGFGAGTDDYICKPFSTSILLARVRAGRRVLELQGQLDRERAKRTRQMSELGAMTRRLRSVTMTDMLTELPNRRYALRRISEEWESSIRRSEPLALVMIDIDHFKQINDSFGHEVGDHVLRETARVLKENTRLGDVVCRFGGEEFLVINIDCDSETALQCSERLRHAVESNVIDYGGFRGSVTISLGVAERTEGCVSIHELLRKADQAVYRAKRSGRNRIDGGDDPSGGFSLRLA